MNFGIIFAPFESTKRLSNKIGWHLLILLKNKIEAVLCSYIYYMFIIILIMGEKVSNWFCQKQSSRGILKKRCSENMR